MKTGYLLGPVMSKIIDSLQQKFLFCYLFQLGILNFVTKIQKLENAPLPPPTIGQSTIRMLKMRIKYDLMY